MEQNIQAVYLPVSYETSSGLVELTSLQEGFKLVGLKEDDVTSLPLPESTLYMSRASQLDREEGQVNKGATMLLRSVGLSNLTLWGSVLVVKGANRLISTRS